MAGYLVLALVAFAVMTLSIVGFLQQYRESRDDR